MKAKTREKKEKYTIAGKFAVSVLIQVL